MKHLAVYFGIILSWQMLFVQQTDACDWRAELLDVTSKEIKDSIVRQKFTALSEGCPWASPVHISSWSKGS
jgi:hypothetical protein